MVVVVVVVVEGVGVGVCESSENGKPPIYLKYGRRQDPGTQYLDITDDSMLLRHDLRR